MREIAREMINIFGPMLVFAFIESSRPIRDEKASIRDRRDRINYWAQNAIPIEAMFEEFTRVFNCKRDVRLDYKEKKIKIEYKKTQNYSKPPNEMEESEANECLEMLQKSVPDIYNDLTRARENLFEYLEKKKKEGNTSLTQFRIEKQFPQAQMSKYY